MCQFNFLDKKKIAFDTIGRLRKVKFTSDFSIAFFRFILFIPGCMKYK